MAPYAALLLNVICLVTVLGGEDRMMGPTPAQVAALRGMTGAEIRRAGLGFELRGLALWVDFAYGEDRLRCWFVAPEAPALRAHHRLWRFSSAYHLRDVDAPGALHWSAAGLPFEVLERGPSPWGRLRQLDPDRYQNRWEVTRHLALERLAFGLYWSMEAPVPGRPGSVYRLDFASAGPLQPIAIAASYPAIVSRDETGRTVGVELIDPSVDQPPPSWWYASHRADGFSGLRRLRP